jgi:alpha-glucuronidase
MFSAGSDGHAAWLEFPRLPHTPRTDAARVSCGAVSLRGSSPTLRQAGDELVAGLERLLGMTVSRGPSGADDDAGIGIGTTADPELAKLLA